MPRKPYIAVQPDNWYRKNTYYFFYMLRELTSVPVALAALNFFWGIAALASSESAWASWINFQRAPIVLIINLIAIVAAVYNSYSWFIAMPKAIRVQRGVNFVPDKVLTLSCWGVFALIFLVLLILAICLA